jgi:hypothetical protein
VVPSTALQFRCNTKTVMSMMPGMVVGGVMHYDFPRLRQRQEWGHEFGQVQADENYEEENGGENDFKRKEESSIFFLFLFPG